MLSPPLTVLIFQPVKQTDTVVLNFNGPVYLISRRSISVPDKRRTVPMVAEVAVDPFADVFYFPTKQNSHIASFNHSGMIAICGDRFRVKFLPRIASV